MTLTTSMNGSNRHHEAQAVGGTRFTAAKRMISVVRLIAVFFFKVHLQDLVTLVFFLKLRHPPQPLHIRACRRSPVR